MDLTEQAVFFEIVDRVERDTANNQHLYAVLEAVNLVTGGSEKFPERAPEKRITYGVQLMQELLALPAIPGIATLSAMIAVMLIGEYAQIRQYDKALASGQTALEILKVEPRLAYKYAACLNDIGAVLFVMGRNSDALAYFEKAVSIYDQLPDRSRGEGARANLETVCAALGRPKKKRGS